jgi:hypothetical protein
MHEGTLAHFIISVRQHPHKVLGEKWIGRGGPIPWPSTLIRTQCTEPFFILWESYLKCLLYVTSVHGVVRVAAVCVCRMLVKQSEGMQGFFNKYR